jgi:hemolysin III
MKPSIQTRKPSLRGYFHQEAFFIALGASALLIAKSSEPLARLSSVIYCIGLLLLFGISAIYHRPNWAPRPRAYLKRLDHSAIYILIASTFTPFCLLALSPTDGRHLLWIVWITALLGTIKSVFFVKSPKWLNALLYIGVGWLFFPYASEFRNACGPENFALILIGGFAYMVGGVFYALKWPKLKPTTFGYHELFHVLTVVGASIHFLVIYRQIQ